MYAQIITVVSDCSVQFVLGACVSTACDVMPISTLLTILAIVHTRYAVRSAWLTTFIMADVVSGLALGAFQSIILAYHAMRYVAMFAYSDLMLSGQVVLHYTRLTIALRAASLAVSDTTLLTTGGLIQKVACIADHTLDIGGIALLTIGQVAAVWLDARSLFGRVVNLQ